MFLINFFTWRTNIIGHLYQFNKRILQISTIKSLAGKDYAIAAIF